MYVSKYLTHTLSLYLSISPHPSIYIYNNINTPLSSSRRNHLYTPEKSLHIPGAKTFSTLHQRMSHIAVLVDSLCNVLQTLHRSVPKCKKTKRGIVRRLENNIYSNTHKYTSTSLCSNATNTHFYLSNI